jgi:hypothetical protein
LKFRSILILMAAVAGLSNVSFATTVNGTAKNGTTDKPAAGDDVVLLQLAQGMNEQARTKTDAQGHFKFDISDDAPHLVRVTHQGVNYFPKGGPIMPGATSVEIQVYDVAKKLDRIGLTVDMLRYQADGGTLSVTELWAVNNTSSPARTQMNDFPFKVQLPEGAQVDSSIAAAPGGQPVQSAPVPTGNKNEYAFVFPLRPGETRFQIAYHLPYSGQATIHSKPDLPVEHVVVMLPKSMQFSPASGAAFQPMGEEEGAQIQVVTKVQPGQDLSFRLSGTGTIQPPQEAAGQPGPAAQPGGSTAGARPGGGLGPPEETPDPLHRYRWYILGGLAVALAAGAVYVSTRPGAAVAHSARQTAAAQRAKPNSPRAVAQPATARQPNDDRSTPLLDALKEELFQLEMDRHQGRISDAEYQKAKAALDLTLGRAAARAKS